MPAPIEPLWPHIAALQGKTLHTVAQGKAFTVERVTSMEAELKVHDGGRKRVIRRQDLEPFWHKLVQNGVLNSSELKTVYKFNTSLAAALLAAVPGVTTSTNPITLRYRA
ncbi:MAG: hypothetical protein U0X20_27035 [Caldilineaceae bacterium]